MCFTETRNWINTACSCLKHGKLLKGRWKESENLKIKFPVEMSSDWFLLEYESQDTVENLTSRAFKNNINCVCVCKCMCA